MTDGALVAVDLGASSGRVIVGHVDATTLLHDEVHRFPNGPVTLPDGLHWDAQRLYAEVLKGLRLARRSAGAIDSLAIDSWAVDYGLLDADGALLGDPYHYRDGRTAAAVPIVDAALSREQRYARTGAQHLPINSVFQLVADRLAGRLSTARRFVMIPDLMGYWLTGELAAEATDASTTGLFDIGAGTWATDVIEVLDLPADLFAPLRRPGDRLGPVLAAVTQATGLSPATMVSLVGSHDTASAVVAVPSAADQRSAYVACGTWSLVGVELEAPILTEASRAANFTNELGVDGRIRYLRNVMGLWLLQESQRTWELAGHPADLGALLAGAADLPDGGPRIDPDDPAFLPPGDMPARIVAACVTTDQPPPPTRPALVRCILDSLAAAYARTVDDAARLSGRDVTVIHLVGGGSRNAVLCQLTADACGLPVVAGPVEATAIGNLLVQARSLGRLSGDLDVLRDLVGRTTALRRFEPRPVRIARGA